MTVFKTNNIFLVTNGKKKQQQQQQQHGPALYLHCKRGEKASQDSIF